MQAIVNFRHDQFYPKNRKSSKHIRYLVIGFDTEYQREAIVNSDGLAEVRNQVLKLLYSSSLDLGRFWDAKLAINFAHDVAF